MKHYDVIIIGGGAAGLMAAIESGKRGLSVLLIEHNIIGEKIRISGGGRCNFTNLAIKHDAYISANPHFVKSALSTFTQFDFIRLIEKHKITYHEKTLGQLFCDNSAKDIINMLLAELVNVTIKVGVDIRNIEKSEYFKVNEFTSKALVVACGGLSIPKLGASDFGYNLAKQFGHDIVQTMPALVPLSMSEKHGLSGISVASKVSYNSASFTENILFTHTGISGPAILQISSYLPHFNNSTIIINLLPNLNLADLLMQNKNHNILLSNFLAQYLSKRFVEYLKDKINLNKTLPDYKKIEFLEIAQFLHNYTVTIQGSGGYAKAEVTKGGVSTKQISSKNMESKLVKNLHFIGEVVDVTGWLGGYNFQWAWSSGYVCGKYLLE